MTTMKVKAIDAMTLYFNSIAHLHNLFLFQCGVTRSLNRYDSRSKLLLTWDVQHCIDCYGILANTGVMLCLHR